MSYKNSRIFRIVLSRLKKPTKNQEIVNERRSVCSSCNFNTKNQEKLGLKVWILKQFSDFYSWVTFNKDEDSLGNCSACDACSIFYKTAEVEYEECPKNKWKK